MSDRGGSQEISVGPFVWFKYDEWVVTCSVRPRERK